MINCYKLKKGKKKKRHLAKNIIILSYLPFFMKSPLKVNDHSYFHLSPMQYCVQTSAKVNRKAHFLRVCIGHLLDLQTCVFEVQKKCPSAVALSDDSSLI